MNKPVVNTIVSGPKLRPVNHKGTTANRPYSDYLYPGYYYYDTTLNKPIWYNGNNTWVDATGATV